MSFNNLMIGAKLRICFAVLVVLMIAVAGLTLMFGSRTSVANGDVARTTEIVTHMKDSFLAVRGARSVLWYYMATGDEQSLQDQKKSFATYDAEYDLAKQMIRTPAGQDAIGAFGADVDAYKATSAKLVDLRKSGVAFDDPRFKALAAEAVAQQKAYAESNDAAAAFFQGHNRRFQAAAADALRGLQLWPSVIAVLSMATAIACAWLMNRNIVHPLAAMTRSMSALAGGDLAVAVPGAHRRDEVGAMAKAVQVFKDAANQNKRLEAEAAAAQMAQKTQQDRQSAIDHAKGEDLKAFVHCVEAGFDALSAGDLTVRMVQGVAPEFEPIRQKFNASVAQLEDTIGSVVGAVGTMRVGLNQITVAAGDLSQRTEQQAASLEETVAALSQVVQGVNATAQGADEARAAASLAQGEAEKGGAVVARAVAAMAEIETSSEKIGRIIGVIDEIAFQTNLLALNAGVEAARAGEAGRGFAVVAQEVRGLAQRSAEAAKEIKDLISTSSAQVGQGVELVSASGRSLEQIVAQVGGVAAAISQMAHAAREQSTSLKEVSVAADQMDKVTQQNAAMVEETTAAAQSLLSETEQLAGLVDGFRTKATARSGAGSGSGAAPKAARAPAASSRAVAQMRTTGRGGAAPKAASDTWEEF